MLHRSSLSRGTLLLLVTKRIAHGGLYALHAPTHADARIRISQTTVRYIPPPPPPLPLRRLVSRAATRVSRARQPRGAVSRNGKGNIDAISAYTNSRGVDSHTYRRFGGAAWLKRTVRPSPTRHVCCWYVEKRICNLERCPGRHGAFSSRCPIFENL